jgi:hypothetical protein
MPAYRQVSLTALECKALWLIADIGYSMPCPDLERDPALESAAERALDKVYRAERGMPRKGHPPGTTHRGPELDVRRKRV